MTRVLRSLLAGGLVVLGGLSPAPAQTSTPDCSREALRGLVDRYFVALAAHDPSGLPLAPNVRSTENGVEVAVGKGLWQTAGKALMRRVLIDTRQCGAHASAVLEEPFSSATVGPATPFSGKKPLPAEGAARPILFGVRLRVEGGRISEIESVVAREREFAFDADGVLATKDQDWESLAAARGAELAPRDGRRRRRLLRHVRRGARGADAVRQPLRPLGERHVRDGRRNRPAG